MKLGIDFGTTHTVAAVVERGSYPVASFEGVDTWPSMIAANTAGELRFGLDAAAVRHERVRSVLRSFKRLLNDAGPRTEVDLSGRYLVTAGRAVEVTLTTRPAGLTRTFQLTRHALASP